jgi:hypothetical protein
VTVALSAFYPLVALACPMVPNPIMDDAIRRACREFCRQTRVLTEDVSLATIVSTSDYAPTLAAQTEIITVKLVRRSASDILDPTTVVDIANQTASSNLPRAYAMLRTYPLSLRFFPTPSTIETLTCTFVVMPTITATAVDDKLADWYLEGVTAYAKYWLLAQVGMPWANPSAAEFAYNQFEVKASEAVISEDSELVDLPVVVQMRPFA